VDRLWTNLISGRQRPTRHSLHIADFSRRLHVDHQVAKSARSFVVAADVEMLTMIGLEHLKPADKQVDLFWQNAELNAEPAILPIFELCVHRTYDGI